jgi:hypothetical protein
VTLTEERIRHNNGVFREANERIKSAAEKYDHQLDRIPFLCECPVEDCVKVVRLTEEQYADVRSNPRHFMTAVGHEAAEAPVGRVFARNNGYVVVEKP